MLEDPEYYRLREELIGFLEERSHLRPARRSETPRSGPGAVPPKKNDTGLDRFLRALTPAA